MSLYTALGISIGVLIVIWSYLALGVQALGLNVWAGVVGWGTFYGAGGGASGLQKGIASNVSGNVYAFLVFLVAGALGDGAAITALLVGVIAFLMCVQAHVAMLSFIPGAFLGAATWVGANVGAELDRRAIMVVVSLALGNIFGYLSEVFGTKLAKRPAAA
jgi:hypothetical protein